MQTLRGMEVMFEVYGDNQPAWTHPFNQATFFNYDAVNSVYINGMELKAAVTIGGIVYPTFLEISLGENQYNTTYFKLDFRNSTTAQLNIIYTEFRKKTMSLE